MDITFLELGATTLLGISAKTAFFFFFMHPAISQEDFDMQFEEYLQQFEIPDDSPLVNSSPRKYVKRINSLKDDFRKHYYSALSETVDQYNHINPIKVNEYLKLFEENKLELERLKLIIQPECVKNINKSANQEYDYVLYRGYWVEWNFKKKLKFSVSLGRVTDVMSGSKIKEEFKQVGEQAIREKLIEEYNKYYPGR
jgi:hypothetical protein